MNPNHFIDAILSEKAGGATSVFRIFLNKNQNIVFFVVEPTKELVKIN
jgi:hypothetical protein